MQQIHTHIIQTLTCNSFHSYNMYNLKRNVLPEKVSVLNKNIFD